MIAAGVVATDESAPLVVLVLRLACGLDGADCPANLDAVREDGLLIQELDLRLHGDRGGDPQPRSDGGAPIWPNRLRQNFQAERPSQKWVADITYIDTREGWLYLAALLDLCSRQVVGWSMGEDLSTSLVEDALVMAVGRRDVGEGLLHHSDQGCQYTSHTYQGRVAELKALVSMSGVGNCYDNAVMDSFFSTLKAECATYRFTGREEARRQIFEFIEIWYNRQRLHSSLDYLSPAEYESRLSSDTISLH